MTEVFIEQSLASPGSSNDWNCPAVPRPVVDVWDEASTVELREKQDTLVTLYLEDRESGTICGKAEEVAW